MSDWVNPRRKHTCHWCASPTRPASMQSGCDMEFLNQLISTLRGSGSVTVELCSEGQSIPLSARSAAASSTTEEPLRCRVPLGAESTLEVTLPDDPVQLARIVEQLLRLSCRLQRASQQKDLQVRALAEQMTYQLEELDYLRKLAVLLELSKQQRSTWEIACELAPLLHSLLLCETLSICHLPGHDHHEPPTWHCEGAALPPNTLDQILTALQTHPHSRQAGALVVNNELNFQSAAPLVRSAIAVPITYNATTYGWLLALNSTCPEGFGTVEASLLRTTAQILGVHASNMALLAEQREFMFKMVQALVSAIDAKDPYTCGHSARVALISKRIATEMGLSAEECDEVYMAGLLHDVGKIGVADRVLLKPGKLTEEEFNEIKRHPQVGHKILQHLKKLSFALPGVLYHHERLDGRGYPEGLRGDQIPLIARIIAVADAFDAMASNRPYRKGMPLRKIFDILRSGAGTQWDPLVVDAFFRALDDILELWSQNLEGYLSFEELTYQSVEQLQQAGTSA